MTIILLHPHTKKLYICTETETTRIVDLNDPDLLKYIPNDDILYVENGHIVKKEQFAKWLSEGIEEAPRRAFQENFDTGFRFNTSNPNRNDIMQNVSIPRFTQPDDPNRLYIHPTHNGTIRIEDIQTEQFPEGIELNGKYHFIPVDLIGQENLEESHHFRVLLAKGKIEIVKENYVRKHAHKGKRRSAGDAALDAILIKDDRHGAAKAVASAGGLIYPESHNDAVIPIYVE